MSLASGTKLGPYEIVSPLGAGGMGEVYKARDPKLERMVAIKVLPEHMAKDADALARFEREAKALAALQHPNVLGIFDFGTESGIAYAAMELLEGETLREALRSGPLPRRKALEVCQQLARGLAAAHGKGILHRDLKPENIFLMKDGQVKILDFGLAKLMTPADPEGPTKALGSSPSTEKGTVLGTVGYMSPEQVRGELLDARSDLFSAGSVMFEILTGLRAFARGTAAETMTAILKEEPPEAGSGGTAFTGPLKRIVDHCLEKDPARRFPDAHGLAFALESAGVDSGGLVAPSLTPTRRPRAAGIALMTLGMCLVAGVSAWVARRGREAAAPGPLVRFDLFAPVGTRFPWTNTLLPFVLSPDGTRLAFVARGAEGRDTLWVRNLAEERAEQVPDTEGASSPFWAPEGRRIGFFAGSRLKVVDLAGGASTTLCVVGTPLSSGSWGKQGTILFAGPTDRAVMLVPDSGGTPRVALRSDAQSGETFTRWPSFLPDGRHFLCLVSEPRDGRISLFLASTEGTRRERLVENCTRAQFVPGPRGRGHILFARDGALLALPFDADSLRRLGEALPTRQDVWQHQYRGDARFSASHTGILAVGGSDDQCRVAWVDRNGQTSGSLGAPAAYRQLRMSPDGGRVALVGRDPRTGLSHLLTGDTARNVVANLDWGPGDFGNPVWSPEGTRLTFTVATPSSPPTVHLKALGDPVSPKPLLPPAGIQRPMDWARDGSGLLYYASQREAGNGLWKLDLKGDLPPVKVLPVLEAVDQFSARISPDGHWIAYTDLEAGRTEVFLTAYPVPGERIRLSGSGGLHPRWKADGRELYFVSADQDMTALSIALGPVPSIGPPRRLFRMSPAGWKDFDVNADGTRFLVIEYLPGQGHETIRMTLNWQGLLKEPG